MLNWLKASGIRRCGLIVKHVQEQRAVPLDNRDFKIQRRGRQRERQKKQLV